MKDNAKAIPNTRRVPAEPVIPITTAITDKIRDKPLEIKVNTESNLALDFILFFFLITSLVTGRESFVSFCFSVVRFEGEEKIIRSEDDLDRRIVSADEEAVTCNTKHWNKRNEKINFDIIKRRKIDEELSRLYLYTSLPSWSKVVTRNF